MKPYLLYYKKIDTFGNIAGVSTSIAGFGSPVIPIESELLVDKHCLAKTFMNCSWIGTINIEKVLRELNKLRTEFTHFTEIFYKAF